MLPQTPDAVSPGHFSTMGPISRIKNLEGWLYKKSPNIIHGWQVPYASYSEDGVC